MPWEAPLPEDVEVGDPGHDVLHNQTADAIREVRTLLDDGEFAVPGPEGPQGEQGPAGDTGPEGPQGEQGPAGDTGPAGSDGSDGSQGPPGADGTDGSDGADGFPTEAQWDALVARVDDLENGG